jgi:hypothetical protein
MVAKQTLNHLFKGSRVLIPVGELANSLFDEIDQVSKRIINKDCL